MELSVIILILGLLTPLAWKFISAQLQQDAERVTYSLLEEADWALTGYAMANDRLPCPAADPVSGNEDCDVEDTGFLPFRTLGVADARAGQIQYGVLRRTGAEPDPEADVPPLEAELPRAADLTQAARDRFYPFFAFLGDGDPLDNMETLLELKTDSDPTPVLDGGPMAASANVPLTKELLPNKLGNYIKTGEIL
ncbi:hypothetical protein AGMMS50256_19750 [Betaproteobacteria bacterium]|nr:hypothetical protein AGMMS50256_19750 [Betaproteobacteria bacterium]